MKGSRVGRIMDSVTSDPHCNIGSVAQEVFRQAIVKEFADLEAENAKLKADAARIEAGLLEQQDASSADKMERIERLEAENARLMDSAVLVAQQIRKLREALGVG